MTGQFDREAKVIISWCFVPDITAFLRAGRTVTKRRNGLISKKVSKKVLPSERDVKKISNLPKIISLCLLPVKI